MSKSNGDRRPSINDVARIAGVSPTTVSHALTGKGRVSADTRTRIQAVAKELGYRGNSLARGLAGGLRGVLALHISPGPGSGLITALEYFAELIDGATVEAMEHGYWLSLTPPSAGVDFWRAGNLDGAIVVDPKQGDETLDELLELGVPVVTTGRGMPDRPGSHWVDNDQHGGAIKIIEHLEAGGARSIALVATPAGHSYVADVKQAFTERLPGHVLEIVDATADANTVHEALRGMLAADPRPDAVCATHERLALATLAAADELGIAVPAELQIASLIDSGAVRNARPPLTVLAQEPAEVGRRAVRMLVALAAGEEIAEPHELIELDVIERASTGGQPASVAGSAITPAG